MKSYIDKLVNSKESRSPCGERGLKSIQRSINKMNEGRSPCGERGLK